MKENYSAWNVQIDDFYGLQTPQDRLRFLINFAVLAPSSHNSQPWKFHVSADSIDILPDTSRSLPESDPQFRHLHMALGCALENILIAAAQYKLQTHIKFTQYRQGLFQIGVCVNENSPSRADVQNNDAAHLIGVIKRRAMHRGKYLERMVPSAFLEKIGQWSRPGIRVDVISDAARRKDIAKIMLDYREWAFDDKNFRREMALFKRNNFTTSFTGIPGFTMGFGNLFSLIAPALIRYTNVIKLIRKGEEGILCDHTPVFCIIGSDGHSPQNWIEVGRTFQRIALEAVNAGMSVAISAVPQGPAELKKKLNGTTEPQLFFRLGYADNEPPHAPRLPAGHVTV